MPAIQEFEPVGRFSSELRIVPEGLTIPAAEAAGRLVVVQSFFDFERHDDMYRGISDFDNEGAKTVVMIKKVDPNLFLGMSQTVDGDSRVNSLCRVDFLSDPTHSLLFGSVSRTVDRDDSFATWVLRRQPES